MDADTDDHRAGGLSPLLRTPLHRFDNGSGIYFQNFLVHPLYAIREVGRRCLWEGAQAISIAEDA